MTGDTYAQHPRDLEGPSILGASWRQFWDLLILTSFTAFRRRYAGTALGFAWMFLGPLLLFGVIYLFVTQVVERFQDIPHYGLMLLMNVILFNYFRLGSSQAMRSLVGSGALVRKMALPRAVLPFSAVAAALYVTVANAIVLFPALIIGGVEPRWTWLTFPLILAAVTVITGAVALLLAGLFLRVRDLGQVWPTLSQVLMYASPVIWPLERLPKEFLATLQTYNPLAPVLAEARVWIIDPSAPGWFDAHRGLDAFTPLLVLIGLWLIAIVVFRREARRAAENY